MSAERGLPVTVYRPGRITGHSETGDCNTDDFLFRMLKGCIQLGAYPAFSWVERAAPVDFVAKATIAISITPRAVEQNAFHLVHAEAFQWMTLFEWTASLGYALQQVTLDSWIAQLEAVRDNHAGGQGEAQNAMLPLLPLLKDVGLEADVPQFAFENTTAALDSSNVRCAPMDYALWARYLAALQRCSFLPPPLVSRTSVFVL